MRAFILITGAALAVSACSRNEPAANAKNDDENYENAADISVDNYAAEIPSITNASPGDTDNSTISSEPTKRPKQ